jgi:hypothetical protein
LPIDLNIGGHKVGVAQSGQVEHLVTDENPEIDGLSRCLGKVAQRSFADLHKIRSSKGRGAEGEHGYAGLQDTVSRAIQEPVLLERRDDAEGGRHRDTGLVADVPQPKGRRILVEQSEYL